MKATDMQACDHPAATEPPAPAEREGTVLHIELRRRAGHWRAAVEGNGEPRREMALGELIRRLADLSAGPGRSSHGLR